MRLFSRQAHLAMDFVTTPERLQLMASSAENFIRHFTVGRTFNTNGDVPRLGADVPRWFGESVAFWDDETLVAWTSNVVPWITHGGPSPAATDACGFSGPLVASAGTTSTRDELR